MSPLVKKSSAVMVGVCTLWIAYYGSYLPLRKSQAYIATLRAVSSVRSFKELTDFLSYPLDLTSPIGHEELVRNTGSLILGLVENAQDPQVAAEAVDFLESYYEPITARGRGMSFSQNLYILGNANLKSAGVTKQLRYFEAAKHYYEEGVKLSPDRPQFLYGLFDIYRIEGNKEEVKKIGDRILSNWPTDERVKKAMDDFLGSGDISS